MNDMTLAPTRTELSARTGFAANLYDRAAELRDDPTAQSALRAAPAARFAVVAGEKPVLRRNGDVFTIWHDAAELAALGTVDHEILLGRDGGAGRFGVRIAAETGDVLKGDPALLVLDLRSLAIQGLLPADELGAIGETKAMTDWHARHQFCANCGTRTSAAPGGWKRECSACGAQHFPRTDPVTIMLVTHGDRCLLARQARFPPGMHSAIAGFIEPGETIEDAVRRETLEETGLVVGKVTYLATQPWPFPSSLMIGCLAEALNDEIVLDRTELEDGRWFSREEATLMLKGQHPDGLTAPVHIAIANTLLKAWLDGGSAST
jgi:NAD+ diphosphatase